MISVAGAGMAGLVAAARLRELCVDVTVREKGTRAGGSMLLSSCVFWRHRDFAEFRAECPGGDERLQRLVWERLDDAIDWLIARGAPVVWEETGNPRTVGKRFDPRGLVAALAGEVELGADGRVDGPLILCTGGFAASADLVARFIAPAAPLLPRGTRVIVVPDGPLHQLSFESLPVYTNDGKGAKAHYWMEDAITAIAPSFATA